MWFSQLKLRDANEQKHAAPLGEGGGTEGVVYIYKKIYIYNIYIYIYSCRYIYIHVCMCIYIYIDMV